MIRRNKTNRMPKDFSKPFHTPISESLIGDLDRAGLLPQRHAKWRCGPFSTRFWAEAIHGDF